MTILCFSETIVSIFKSILYHVPEDQIDVPREDLCIFTSIFVHAQTTMRNVQL